MDNTSETSFNNRDQSAGKASVALRTLTATDGLPFLSQLWRKRMSEPSAEQLKRTPLYDLHLAHGARMVPFAGYEMPVQYPAGVKNEHLHTRSQAGLFDVSHMGQLLLSGPGADAFLETLVTVDIIDLPVGKQRYALLTNETGGIIDDLMVSRHKDFLHLVVNASRKTLDTEHIRARAPADVSLETLDNHALIALQGPESAQVLQEIVPGIADMVFMDSRTLAIDDIPCLISRSGYTGEDGFEISIPEAHARQIAERLLAHAQVALIGLGARDSLRLESGLCLYGQDINERTTPVEASLGWAISKSRRSDGARAGNFPGAGVILSQLDSKQTTTRRVGLKGNSKAPVRAGTELVDARGQPVGLVTSGTFGPSVAGPIAMARVNTEHSALGNELFALVRGKKLPMTVSKMPFVPQRYARGLSR